VVSPQLADGTVADLFTKAFRKDFYTAEEYTALYGENVKISELGSEVHPSVWFFDCARFQKLGIWG
jgi:hypothetical protein